MNIADRLSNIWHDFETGDVPRETVDVLEAHINKLVSSKVADLALPVGSIAPLDTVVHFEGSAVSVGEFCEADFLILNWFRGNW